MHKTAAQLVSEAYASIESLTVDQLSRELAAHELVLVDIREAEEHKARAIPGALSMPRGMLEFYADPTNPFHRPELHPSRRVVLYCGSGGRSALAVSALQVMGYGRIAQLEGGIKGWEAAGMPVVAAGEPAS